MSDAASAEESGEFGGIFESLSQINSKMFL